MLSGHASKWLPVNSGVPQGSILGPLMFLIYIDDITQVVEYSKICLFADDAKMYITVHDTHDCLKIQNDLDAVNEWCLANGMRLNNSKCKVLKVTRKKNSIDFIYTINGNSVDNVSEIRDLGVIIDEKISWNQHIHNIIVKANRVMGLIKRAVGYDAPRHVKLQLFATLVRSKLEYCTQVWGGISQVNMVKLERVQRSATRYILDYPDMCYRDRLCELNMLPLTYRRDISDIVFFHKCFYHGVINVTRFVNFTRNNTVHTRSLTDNSKLCIPHCRTEQNKVSYFRRIISLWNNLPELLRAQTDTQLFKRHVISHYFTKLAAEFTVEKICTWH